jgi:hypothetical protein
MPDRTGLRRPLASRWTSFVADRTEDRLNAGEPGER